MLAYVSQQERPRLTRVGQSRRMANGALEAGPVSPTVPELPVYLSFAGTDEAYTSVTARLSNGHTFTFDALPFL